MRNRKKRNYGDRMGTQARLAFTDPMLAKDENAREYIRKNTVLTALQWVAENI